MTTVLATEPQDWRVRAACGGHDPELWFPPAIESGNAKSGHPDVWGAVAVCRACPVQQECLRWSVRHGEAYGIWGAMTPIERRDAFPNQARRQPTLRVERRSSRIDAIEQLAGIGTRDADIARLLNIRLDSVARSRRRHGIPPGRVVRGGEVSR